MRSVAFGGKRRRAWVRLYSLLIFCFLFLTSRIRLLLRRQAESVEVKALKARQIEGKFYSLDRNDGVVDDEFAYDDSSLLDFDED